MHAHDVCHVRVIVCTEALLLCCCCCCCFILFIIVGILKQFREDLLSCRSLEELGQFLGNLPPVESDTLFLHIESVHFTAKKFRQVLSQEQKKPAFDSAPAIV